MKVFVKHSVVDKVLALLALVVALPVFILIALAVKLDSPGPVIYKQKRLGRGCKSFTLLKFRTMFVGSEHCNKTADDVRYTRVGKWLRKSSLDELPQFINVLVGTMSLVGPRPRLPDEEGAWADLFFMYNMKPGITGLWQVSGRHDLADEIRVELDLLYVHGWNLLIDTKILLKTIPAVITAKGAY